MIQDLLLKSDEYHDTMLWLRDHVNNLQDLRTSAGVSQKKLAECADVHQSNISFVENGRFYGIGRAALCRIVSMYKELEVYSKECTDGRTGDTGIVPSVRQESGVEHVEGPRG